MANTYTETDEEAAIVKSISKHLPDIDHFRCSIHVWQNAKIKMEKQSDNLKARPEAIQNANRKSLQSTDKGNVS